MFGFQPPSVKDQEYIDDVLLKIWCNKNSFDDGFLPFLKEQEIKSLSQIVLLSRWDFIQLLARLDINAQQFTHPEDEETFVKLIDAEGVFNQHAPPMPRGFALSSSAPFYSGGPVRDSFAGPPMLQTLYAFPAMAPAGRMSGRGGMKRSTNNNNNNNKSKSMKRSAAPMSSRSRAMSTMESKSAMAFGDDDDDTIGFKVGGDYDVTMYRDKLQHCKMPTLKDVSIAGLYNDYYFDTKRGAQKGSDMEDDGGDEDDDDEKKAPADGDEQQQEEEEEEDVSQDKKLFYPSYFYAKSRAPFALLAAKSVSRGIPDEILADDNDELKPLKTPNKRRSQQNVLAECDERHLQVWNGYLDRWGKEPRKSTELQNFASQNGYGNLRYAELNAIFNRYKGGGKIEVIQKTATKKEEPLAAAEEQQTDAETTKKPAEALNPPSSNDMFDDDDEDITFDVDDKQAKRREIFMTVGLNSNISASDFERRKLNLCVLLDISGSMNRAFTNETDSTSKIEVAKRAILALVSNLRGDDHFALVTFNRNASTQIPFTAMKDISMATLNHILMVSAHNGTSFTTGYAHASNLYGTHSNVGSLDAGFDHRIVMLTDLNPNLGTNDVQRFMDVMAQNSTNKERRIYTTLIGVGLDFNSDLVQKLAPIRGCNHFSVHSNAEFLRRLDAEFAYFVTPLVFDFSLTLRSEGDGAYVEQVWGVSGAAAEGMKTGEIMRIDTMFPSPPSDSDGGEKKGGIVLLKIAQRNYGDDAQKMFRMVLECKFEDKHGRAYSNTQMVEFGEDNLHNDDDYFDNYGVQKGILLARYYSVVREWLKHDRYFYPNKLRMNSPALFVSPRFKKIFKSFEAYFGAQMQSIGDDSLQKEMDILRQFVSDDLQPLHPPEKPMILAPTRGRPSHRALKTRGRPYHVEAAAAAEECAAADFNFKSLSADIRLVSVHCNAWTLNPEINICDDIGVDVSAWSEIRLRSAYRKWVQNALAEHASIGSFSRFSLDLMSLNAPSFLLRLAHESCLEEITHAKIAFDVANLIRMALNKKNHEAVAQVVNPAEFPPHGVAVDANKHRILSDLVQGGCVNELVSALESVSEAVELRSKQLLMQIALDEARHCSLAWCVAFWMMKRFHIERNGVLQMLRAESIRESDDDQSKEYVYATTKVIPEIIRFFVDACERTSSTEINLCSVYDQILAKIDFHIRAFQHWRSLEK